MRAKSSATPTNSPQLEPINSSAYGFHFGFDLGVFSWRTSTKPAQESRSRQTATTASQARINSADRLYLVIESIKRDTKHPWSSNTPAPDDRPILCRFEGRYNS